MGESIMSPNKIAYIHSDKHLDLGAKLPMTKERALMVHYLLEAYDLLKYLDIVSPHMATVDDLCDFHCPEYIALMKAISNKKTKAGAEKIEPEYLDYGICFDCPPFQEIFPASSIIAGASIKAADLLIDEDYKYVLHLLGGWHHAFRDEAAGFCYVNDIVLSILRLRSKFQRILYIDIDLHHGDAVEAAFYSSPNVFTLSFHKFEKGFFPGTGDIDCIGKGPGKYFSCNVPLKDGCKDEIFQHVVQTVVPEVIDAYEPEVIVLQTGCDTLTCDPNKSFGLTTRGIGNCVSFILDLDLPILCLGGGGYNYADAARCWTHMTSLFISKTKDRALDLDMEIPEHEYHQRYGPTFRLETVSGEKNDENKEENISLLLQTISSNLRKLKKRERSKRQKVIKKQQPQESQLPQQRQQRQESHQPQKSASLPQESASNHSNDTTS